MEFKKLTLTAANGDVLEFDLQMQGVEASISLDKTRAKIVVEGPWRRQEPRLAIPSSD